MFQSFIEVVRLKKNAVYPIIAKKHALKTRKPSVASLTSYANALLQKYPEQLDLINDIAIAGLGLNNDKSIRELQEELIDLERYLIDTRY